MKALYLAGLFLLASAVALAQVRTHPSRRAATLRLLKSHNDSVSYAVGVTQARNMKEMHTGFNMDAVNMGLSDSLNHRKAWLIPAKIKNLEKRFDKLPHTDSTYLYKGKYNPGTRPYSFNDSLSYAFGLDVAHDVMVDYGVKTLNYDIFNKALADYLDHKPMPLTTLQSRKVLMNINRPEFLNNLAASKKFMADNHGKPGVITLPNGLQYTVLKTGTGANIMMGDSVSTHYKGTLIDGKQFDSSYDRGEPLKLTDITRVIAGWTEGLQLMNLGAKYRFFIPPNLAYGSRQRSDIITPYSALIFDVEVLKINNRAL